MSKKAKEIIELHLGSDYWKFEESEYFENLINAVDEALSITFVGQSFYCHRKKWLKEEGCRWQCNECIKDVKKYGQ